MCWKKKCYVVLTSESFTYYVINVYVPRVRANADQVLTTPPRVSRDPKKCWRNMWTAPYETVASWPRVWLRSFEWCVVVMLSTVVHSSVPIFAGNLCCVMQVAAAAAALSTRYSIVKISEDVYFDLPKLFTVREKPCGRDAQVIVNDSRFMDTI